MSDVLAPPAVQSDHADVLSAFHAYFAALPAGTALNDAILRGPPMSDDRLQALMSRTGPGNGLTAAERVEFAVEIARLRTIAGQPWVREVFETAALDVTAVRNDLAAVRDALAAVRGASTPGASGTTA